MPLLSTIPILSLSIQLPTPHLNSDINFTTSSIHHAHTHLPIRKIDCLCFHRSRRTDSLMAYNFHSVISALDLGI